VAVACDAESDVCKVIRDELIRQLRSSSFPDAKSGNPDIALTVNINPVSDRIRPGAAPVMLHTISVELNGRSGRTAVPMPAPRVFEFDPVFGRPQLQQTAQSVAADAIEALRGFAARQ